MRNAKSSLSAMAVWVIVGFAVSFSTNAAPVANPHALQVTKLELSDFLAAQGTTSNFFPPVSDYLGWVDGGFVNFALVDYAGLADGYLGGALGTEVKGTVIERQRDDGRREIIAKLHTKKALGFAQSIEDLAANGFDFGATPTIFGNKAVDVAAGAEPAVGSALLHVSFTIAPGDPLPNLLDVINFDTAANFQPVRLQFKSTTFDGTGAKLRVQQDAATNANGELIYTKEVVEIGGKK